MKVLDSKKGITSVAGISAYGDYVGIKSTGKNDFGVIFSESTASAAMVVTKNKVKAAPVLVNLSQMKKSKGKIKAAIINSGNANACTGKEGIKNARKTISLAAKELGVSKKSILVFSTGMIGKQLPMEEMKKGITGVSAKLGKGHYFDDDVAKAIMTTDTVKKAITVKYDNIVVSGIAKGSGMIHPNMATMLAFITTNAKFTPNQLQKMLTESVQDTFNMITVDGDTSTNDSVLLIAANKNKTKAQKFQKALDFVCLELAKKIVLDGEGATKMIKVIVQNASTEQDAKKAAKAVAQSPLVKTAMFGNDPNWGRILAAVGYSGAKMKQEKVDLYIGNYHLVKQGQPRKFNKKKVSSYIASNEMEIFVDLHMGKKEATAYGCDLSYDYVEINAEYHT